MAPAVLVGDREGWVARPRLVEERVRVPDVAVGAEAWPFLFLRMFEPRFLEMLFLVGGPGAVRVSQREFSGSARVPAAAGTEHLPRRHMPHMRLPPELGCRRSRAAPIDAPLHAP